MALASAVVWLEAGHVAVVLHEMAIPKGLRQHE